MTEHRNRIIFEQLIYRHKSIVMLLFSEQDDITYIASTISQQTNKIFSQTGSRKNGDYRPMYFRNSSRVARSLKRPEYSAVTVLLLSS